jgi:glycosyltransferase involved in cell wall biosynthesis
VSSQSGTVLFAANYPANTGFAWSHIEQLFGRVADILQDEQGTRTFVAYPEIREPPRTLEGSCAAPVELDVSLTHGRSVRTTVRFIRRENVRVLYLTDRRVFSWKYALLRLAGVRRILVHDRTSGARIAPTGVKRMVKTLVHRFPPTTADQYIAVSDFVKRRLLEVARVSEEKVIRVYNGFSIPYSRSGDSSAPTIREQYRIDKEVPLIACACRAAREKGVDHLLRAFERLVAMGGLEPAPFLVYLGDGPHMRELRRLRETLDAQDRILLPGYVADAVRKLRSADLFVVPSVWEDAFPSAVLEPMALGKPVVASAVGGIPEAVQQGVTGLLVPPGDEYGLAEAMRAVLSNPDWAQSLGREAERRVESKFRLTDQIAAIAELVNG